MLAHALATVAGVAAGTASILLTIATRGAPNALRAVARRHGLACAVRLPMLAPLLLQRVGHRLRQATCNIEAGDVR